MPYSHPDPLPRRRVAAMRFAVNMVVTALTVAIAVAIGSGAVIALRLLFG